jgi:hypothetical protein
MSGTATKGLKQLVAGTAHSADDDEAINHDIQIAGLMLGVGNKEHGRPALRLERPLP